MSFPHGGGGSGRRIFKQINGMMTTYGNYQMLRNHVHCIPGVKRTEK